MPVYCFFFPVDFVFVFFADDAAVKMIDTGFVYIVDAKVVDDKREQDISGFVTEQTFGVFSFDIVVFCEMFDKVVVRAMRSDCFRPY